MYKFVGDLYVPTNQKIIFDFEIDKDVTFIVNLEAPITEITSPYCESKISIKQNFIGVSCLRDLNNVIVNLSNNHILDFGAEGIEDTTLTLKNWDIDHFGIVMTDKSMSASKLIKTKQTTYILLAYTCQSANPIFSDKGYELTKFSYENCKRDMLLAKSVYGHNIRIIINVHAGLEEVSIPEPTRLIMTREVAKLNPYMIISHHSHVIQPYEYYHGVHVFYGIGNFYFPNFEYIHPNGEVSWGVQRSWNNRSLAINIHNNDELSFDFLLRKGFSVIAEVNNIELSSLTDVFFKKFSNNKYYTIYFKILYKYCMVRQSVSRFIAKPKIPSLKSLKHLLLGS